MSTQKLTVLRNRRELYAEVFGLGFLAVMLSLLPMLILDKGYFIYYGDFNSQQLPFYYHANEVIRSGGLFGWDWGTDLGSSFIGSYAFYLTGSPFFWLTLLLPQDAVPYAVPWLLGIKHGVAALTAYGWIRRFVRTPHAAAAGALLYACSGFQLYNIFFNHFHDVTAFFPLMLLAMEELVCHGRRGWFAASVALLACINYYFFAGQVVFLILYFLFRLKSEDFPVTWKKFAALAMEAVIGVMIACAVLFPAALAVIGNSRVSQHLYGQNMLFYNDQTRILHIIQSFFMIPDIPAYPNLFPTDNAGTKWGSIGGYLPLFSMAGVITFMGQKKRHWAANLIRLCILCALVPVLNSIFYLFNGAFYARWYYMPILIMAMMTTYALDDRTLRWKNGLIASFAVPMLFGVISLLPTQDAEGKTVFLHFAENIGYFFIVLAAVLLCWLGSFWICCLRSEKKPYLRLSVWLTAAACIVCTSTMIWFGKCNIHDSHAYIRQAIGGRDAMRTACTADDADCFRLDMPENCDNYPMFWGMSSMRCFQSVVSPSIMEFYQSIGIPRDVSSRAPLERYALRGLFSVKYCLQEADANAEPLKLPGFVYDRTENGFNIYRNDDFIPMGFTYDSYVTDEMLDGMTDQIKERILIRSLLLTQEQAETYADILHENTALNVGKEEYLAECRRHAAECCEHFTHDAGGFAADITLDAPKLVFFSVPYDAGWTAEINGMPARIENVDHGFMAVRCEAGSHHITFRYTLPGLRCGVIVTGAGLLLLVLYLALGRGLVREGRMMQGQGEAHRSSTAVRAADAYVRAWQAEMQYQKGEQNHGTSERDQAER